MKLADFYNFENERFAPLRDASRKVTEKMQNANRGLDTMKEIVLIEMGLVNTSNEIHKLAHKQPGYFDQIGDILHQRHLIQEYPATEEYTKKPEDLDEVFEEVIRMLQESEDALKEFVKTADECGLYALAREAEGIEIENSHDYEKIMYAWQMLDESDGSATSFDNWVKHLFDGGED